MRSLVAEAGLQDDLELDSAGTGAWHVGEPPDRRATATAAAAGVELRGAARQVTDADFEEFDLILAMDAANASDLRRGARTEAQRSKVRLLREFDADSAARGELDVPDPYYGGPGGFDEVLALVKAACEGLLVQVRATGVR
jgi:protein-tyrosine phosphatase